MDDASGEMEAVANLDIGSLDFPAPDEAAGLLRSWDWNPWSFDLHQRSYWANASGESLENHHECSALPPVGLTCRYDGWSSGEACGEAPRACDRIETQPTTLDG